MWLPVRDQNPFVLGSGLPLLPQPAPAPGNLSVEATLSEANSQLKGQNRQQHTALVFGAETRETRLTASYAFDENWAARASIGAEWIGVGFLDKPIQHFHRWIGAPRGYRGGRLGERLPVIRVVRDGDVLYALDQPGQALAPMLLDVTREWTTSESTRYGMALGIKVPIGDSKRLSDTGDTGVSVSGFVDTVLFDWVQVGARVGYLHSGGNDVLPGLARSSVPFADVAARGPLLGQWNWTMQYDVHGPLYRQVPQYLGYAGVYTIGVARPMGAHSELVLGISEDVPLGHTQDVSFLAAVRY